MKRPVLGVFFLAVLISILGGVAPVFTKIGLEVVDSFTLIFFRFFIALLVFLPFLRIKKETWVTAKRYWKDLLIVGIISGLNPILLFIALKFTQASVSPFDSCILSAS